MADVAAAAMAAAAVAAEDPAERGKERQQGTGIVVRNTFIDVCPAEEDSDGDGAGSCPSPQRRNVSAPPSPTRQRGGAWESSDEEVGEDPEIPNYTWGDGGIVPADSGGVDKGLEDDRIPHWLQKAPPSPKKIPTHPRHRAQKDRPALGNFLTGGDPSWGAAGAYDPIVAGLGTGTDYPPGGLDTLGADAGAAAAAVGLFGAQAAAAAAGNNDEAAQLAGRSKAWAGTSNYDPSILWEDASGSNSLLVPPSGKDYGATCQAVLTQHGGGQPGCQPWPMPDAYCGHLPMSDPYAEPYGDYPVRVPQGGHPHRQYGAGGQGACGPSTSPVLASQPLPSTGMDATIRRSPFPQPSIDHDSNYYGMPQPQGCQGGYGGGGIDRGRGRGGRGQGQQQHPPADPGAPPPWVMATAMHMPWLAPAGDDFQAGGRGFKGGHGDFRGGAPVGRDGRGPAAASSGGRVPLSGGGPKRTDYLKKYGEGDTGGGVPITTMMLKNIPCRKAQEEVMSHIDQKGFGNRYDFFYLPRDVKFRANLGYAFINFLTPADAASFQAEFNGYRFSGSGSTKACQVVPAHVQGLTNNLAAFKRTEVMRSSRKPFFSTAPEANW